MEQLKIKLPNQVYLVTDRETGRGIELTSHIQYEDEYSMNPTIYLERGEWQKEIKDHSKPIRITYRRALNPDDKTAWYTNREGALYWTDEDTLHIAELTLIGLRDEYYQLVLKGREHPAYKALAPAIKEVVYLFRTDFTIVDASILASNPNDNYLWLIRETGTDLFTGKQVTENNPWYTACKERDDIKLIAVWNKDRQNLTLFQLRRELKHAEELIKHYEERENEKAEGQWAPA